MTYKSTKLRFHAVGMLMVFCLSLFPLPSQVSQAEEAIHYSLNDAISLMYISDAILLNEIVDDETNSISKVSSRTPTGYLPDETTDLIDQMINATKQIFSFSCFSKA